MELIAEKIESEDDLAELLGYGIDYGQGYLFGVPSPSRDA
jgi:cyclic-di-GMP phosphodiesterase TipF (flagellum assembly factor)